MGLFDAAKDSFKGAVGDVGEKSVDSMRDAIAEVIQDQLEDLLGKAVVKMIASVNEEFQAFAALQLATKADIARLEASIAVALAASSVSAAKTAHALEVRTTEPARRRRAVAPSRPPVAAGATTTTTTRRSAKARQA